VKKLTPIDLLFGFVGIIMIFCAACSLVLFSFNLAARYHHFSPIRWSFLWVTLYLLGVGVGTLKLKKWAVILLFLPGSIYLFLFGKSLSIGDPQTIFLGFLWCLFLLVVPIALCTRWRSLAWV